MKTSIFTLMVVFVIAYGNEQASATTRRVGYTGPAVAGIDYSALQTAHDVSSPGDTLLIFPGNWSANYSKKLVTIGTGYFVSGGGSNADLQNITGASNFYVNLLAGSDNCFFDGIDMGAGYIYPKPCCANVSISNITIRRCRGIIRFDQSSYRLNLSNWKVSQCYINFWQIGSSWLSDTITNLQVNNCYINSIAYNGTLVNGVLGGQFYNNVFYDVSSGLGNGSFLLQNNVFLLSHVNDLNCIYQNNIFNSSYPGSSANANQNIADMSSIFAGYPLQGSYSNDGRWVLKSGSPATGTGNGGTDCGIFGGANPYKLSGIPAIPAFYKLTAPSDITSSNPYTVTFSVRSNN